jgi:hypothetical protein
VNASGLLDHGRLLDGGTESKAGSVLSDSAKGSVYERLEPGATLAAPG